MLAELHAHLYGTVPAGAVLRRLLERGDSVFWEWYESRYEAAYGRRPATRQLVLRCADGAPEARAEFEREYVFGDDDAGTFERFSAKAGLIWAASEARGQYGTVEGVEYAAGLAKQLQREGVAYAELRHHPDGAVLAELARLSAEGPTMRLAARLDRDDPWPGWQEVLHLLDGPDGHALTGIDFCGVEEGRPPKQLRAFMATLQAFNQRRPERALAVLYHVGESFRDKSLESAVRWVQEAAEMGAHRLGHAIALGVDPRLFGAHVRTEPVSERIDQLRYDLTHLDDLRGRGVAVTHVELEQELDRLLGGSPSGDVTVVYDDKRLEEVRCRQDLAIERIRATSAVIEVCPTSNRRIAGVTDAAQHPIHRFLEAALPVVIGTDDAGVFGTMLIDELDWVAAHVGMPWLREQLIATAWNSRSEILSARTVAT